MNDYSLSFSLAANLNYCRLKTENIFRNGAGPFQ